MVIYIHELRKYHCVRGIRAWFEKNGLDFKKFLREGIESDLLVDTGDAMAISAVDKIRKIRGE